MYRIINGNEIHFESPQYSDTKIINVKTYETPELAQKAMDEHIKINMLKVEEINNQIEQLKEEKEIYKAQINSYKVALNRSTEQLEKLQEKVNNENN